MSRRFAKVLCFLVIPLFLFTTPTTTYAAASDISGHWAEETLIKWVGQGWLTGNGEGTFSPNKSVTRAEFVALVNRMKGYKGDADISNFTDVTPDKWYYKDIKAAISAGYLAGTGPRSISPEKTITRQEAIAIVSRIEGVSGSDASALSYATDGNSVAGWAQKSVAACINVGYVTGSEGKINPLSNITKAEAIVLLNNVNTKTRSFALAGTFGPTSGKLSASKVNVLAAGVNLRNVAVSGDFVIDKAVGNGDVRLDAVDVNGTLLVEGGGLNSIYVNNCKIGKLDVTKNECRVDVDEGSSVTNAIARGWNSIIEFRSGVTVDNLTVIGRDNRITLSSTAVIDAIEVRGANTKIETEAGSLIKLITVDASTKIVGNGTILVANVSADLTTEKKPDTVNIKGNGEVIIGSSTASPVYSTPIPPSGGGGGGGSYYPTSTP
ncbi:MAG: S-layer homology domain-containing protein, partial [Clostridiales bacterium]|nr:S-layer homology domain-containing protein [Clostridiales bacterium]